MGAARPASGASTPIPLAVPEIRGNEARYLRECIDTNWVSSVGPFVDRFEQEVATRLGARQAVAVASGTAALHLALRVAGVRADEEVIVSTLTFIAPANAVRYLGAWPVFLDAEPEYGQMDVGRVADFLTNRCRRDEEGVWNRATGRRVSAILPVHILGHPVDLDPILDLAGTYDLWVIQDAAECLGATYRGEPPSRRGDLTCLSFNGNKIVTTGGGGMVVTDDEELAERVRRLSTQAKSDPVEYIHDEVGYNYRLTNLQAAVGCAQMEKLDEFVAAKRATAVRYNEAFAGVPGLATPGEAEWARSTYWLYTILLDEAACGISSRGLLGRLSAAGIQSRPLWQPMHLSPAHGAGVAEPCPVAEALYARALSLPCSVGLTAADQGRVIDAVLAEVRR